MKLVRKVDREVLSPNQGYVNSVREHLKNKIDLRNIQSKEIPLIIPFVLSVSKMHCYLANFF